MSAIVFNHFKVCDDIAEIIDKQVHQENMKDICDEIIVYSCIAPHKFHTHSIMFRLRRRFNEEIEYSPIYFECENCNCKIGQYDYKNYKVCDGCYESDDESIGEYDWGDDDTDDE